MPNVKFQTHVDKTGELRLGVFVLKRKIKKGEEVNIHNVLMFVFDAYQLTYVTSQILITCKCSNLNYMEHF